MFISFSLLSRYRCECDAGWEGRHCEQEKDECSTNPCQNGGICVDRHNGYTCQCQLGFRGKTGSLNTFSVEFLSFFLFVLFCLLSLFIVSPQEGRSDREWGRTCKGLPPSLATAAGGLGLCTRTTCLNH